MVLVACDRTWTFGLCSLCFLLNMLVVRSLVENQSKEPYIISKSFQKQYRFEDFFWTGSGDGSPPKDLFNNSDADLNLIETSPIETWRTTTVFHTTTILFATVYSNSEGCMNHGCEPKISTVQTNLVDFSLPAHPPSRAPEIQPNATKTIFQTTSFKFPNEFFDQKNINESFNENLSPPIALPTESINVFPNIETNESPNPKIHLNLPEISTTLVFPNIPLDQKYWILTVLRTNDYFSKLDINSTEIKLSLLYEKAFNRRQVNFLNEDNLQRKHLILYPVKAHILNVTCVENNIEVIYFVTVGGKPLPAVTATNEMRLITANEVIAELGYPIVTKAEPYMKNEAPLGARVKGRTRDTWLFIGSVTAAVLLLIIFATIFAFGLSKNRNKRNTTEGTSNKKQIFDEEGVSNKAFEEELESKKVKISSNHEDISKGKFKTMKESSYGTVKFTEEERRRSSTSSVCSGSSEASLVRLRHQQRRKEQKRNEKEERSKLKSKSRARRIESSDCCKGLVRQELVQSGGSALSKNTFDEITEGYDDMECSSHLAKSPTSYLSMPSVKAFPRGTKITEPLNKILEPTSIRHFDVDSDSQNDNHQSAKEHSLNINASEINEIRNKSTSKKVLTRHASLEGDDPGFIGPVVWNRHCRKISEEALVEENVNVGKMRKRFNELLDDALSMFGSRTGSPDGSDVVPARQMDSRVHSAVVRPASLSFEGEVRPKTTGSKRPQSSAAAGPRGAWETPSCSTLGRPASAEFFSKAPTVDRNLIYVNCELPLNDPAIPLIAAIKKELKKFEDPLQSSM